MLLLLQGCFSRKKPNAELMFSSFEKSDARYSIAFYSNLDIDSLFSPAGGEKTVARSLVCALERDNAFKVEHNISKIFDGDLVLNGKAAQNKYRYISTGNFFQAGIPTHADAHLKVKRF